MWQFSDWSLDPYYLNYRRVVTLVGGDAVVAAVSTRRGTGNSTKLTETLELWSMCDLFLQWLKLNSRLVDPFEMLVNGGSLSTGMLFSVFKDFYCKDVRVMRRRGVPSMRAKFNLPDPVELHLSLDRSHVAPGSAGDRLSGHVSELFVVAVAESVEESKVSAIPIFVGNRIKGRRDEILNKLPARSLEVHPEQWDAFTAIQNEAPPTRADLKALRCIPENDIKHAFACRIGEQAVPKDWGGEYSDLFSSQVSVGGEKVTAAFLLKGPGSGFSPMTPVHLGKNGDQIGRLFNEPADLLVLQHCHEIRSSVRSQMQAYANQMHRLRRYCIIDGYSTLKILRAYALCGQSSVPAR